jgi:molybdopterin molybdotransferase
VEGNVHASLAWKGDTLITADAAWQNILEHVSPLEPIDRLALDALGSVLAESVVAVRDFPPCNRSSVDGFAVRTVDLENAPVSLQVIGEIPAGAPPILPLGPGTCVRIFTGACVPESADAAEMVEHTSPGTTPDLVTFQRRVRPGANVLKRGEDCAAGSEILGRGTRLGPVHLGILASNGTARVAVHRRPRVSVLVTGQELAASPGLLPPYQIHDSNGPMIQALLSVHGFPVLRTIRIPDDLEAISEEIANSIGTGDAVVLSGGVSVGKYDFVPEAIRRAGGSIAFHGVSLKPGKPQLFATFGANRFAFGLPGNPLSALTGMTEFVLPALRRLAGWAPAACRPGLRLPLLHPLKVTGRRQRVLLARLVHEEGVFVEMLPNHSSGDLISAGAALGLAIAPAGVAEIPAGTLVLFRPIWGCT